MQDDNAPLQQQLAMERARVARKEAELDDIRRIVRNCGVEQFGSTLEGVVQMVALLRASPLASVIIDIDADMARDMRARIRDKVAIINDDPQYRTVFAFKQEVLLVAIAMLCKVVNLDAGKLLLQIEAQVGAALTIEYDLTQRKQEARTNE
jgi:hypothetical protein